MEEEKEIKKENKKEEKAPYVGLAMLIVIITAIVGICMVGYTLYFNFIRLGI